MDSKQSDSLAKQLNVQIDNIFNDFNEILRKYGFPQTHVVSFTVQQSTVETTEHKGGLNTLISPDLRTSSQQTTKTIIASICWVDENNDRHCKDKDPVDM